MAILEVRKLTKRFGGVEALSDVDLVVQPGEVIGVIGPNGAGKSTFFNLLSGVMRPSGGRVVFEGSDITGSKPHRIAQRGLVRTFQGTTLFSDLTVFDNVYIACHIPAHTNLVADAAGLPSVRRREREMRERSAEIVELAGLTAVSGKLARDLPHGHQRALGVAAALATGPRLLCLDEPVTGMNAEEIEAMMGFIERIRLQGITILLVEHAMRVVMSVCERIMVLNFGKKIAEGGVDAIQNDPAVIEAYLGRPDEDAA
jgi:ABC-type branched-subunit amino acid transport system ATPase component